MEHSTTSVTLLLRLRRSRNDETAWREFVERYGSRIYHWCLNRKLSPDDADDVTQNVLLRLAQKLEQFEYDESQSFRGWLRRVTENAITDYVRSRKTDQSIGGSSVFSLLAVKPAPADLAESLAEAFDLELLEMAKSRVKKRVSETRWLSWELSTTEDLTGKEIAAKLGISVGNMYANKNQIQNLIREEVERLEKMQET